MGFLDHVRTSALKAKLNPKFIDSFNIEMRIDVKCPSLDNNPLLSRLDRGCHCYITSGQVRGRTHRMISLFFKKSNSMVYPNS